jgi:EmrB/QacA subfamily drug resistance transporter
MDSTVLATSLPAIAADIGENPLSLKFALTSYLVGLAIFIPISGWVADKYGSRTIFAWAIVVFLGGSLACAASSSLGFFVVARFVQGIGGAMMVPVGRLVLLKSVGKTELVAALNYLTIPALIGPIMGPPLGGLITQYFNWRGIFLINVPISILGMYLVLKHIPNIREDELPPLDRLGFVLLGFGLSLLMLGISALGGHLLPWSMIAISIALGLLTLELFRRHSRTVANPVVDLSLAKIPTFNAGVIGGSLFRTGMGATPLLMPLMFQLGFGLDPFHSGLITCCTAIGAMFMKTLTLRILNTFGFREVLVWNALMSSFAGALYGAFTAQTSLWIVVPALLITGCMRSLQFTALNAISFADIGREAMSPASSMQSMTQRLSQSLGVALGAYALELSSWAQGHTAIVAADFWPAFVFVGLIGGSSVLLNVTLAPHAGAQLARRDDKALPEKVATVPASSQDETT